MLTVRSPMPLMAHSDLPCACFYGGETKVIMAVRGDDRVINIFDMLFEVSDNGPVLFRLNVADSVGDVDGCCSGGDDGLDDLREKCEVTAGCVFCGELHVFGEGGRMTDGFVRHFKNLLRGFAEFVLHVNRACRKEHMDSRVGCALQGIPCTVDICNDRAASPTT